MMLRNGRGAHTVLVGVPHRRGSDLDLPIPVSPRSRIQTKTIRRRSDAGVLRRCGRAVYRRTPRTCRWHRWVQALVDMVGCLSSNSSTSSSPQGLVRRISSPRSNINNSMVQVDTRLTLSMLQVPSSNSSQHITHKCPCRIWRTSLGTWAWAGRSRSRYTRPTCLRPHLTPLNSTSHRPRFAYRPTPASHRTRSRMRTHPISAARSTPCPRPLPCSPSASFLSLWF